MLVRGTGFSSTLLKSLFVIHFCGTVLAQGDITAATRPTNVVTSTQAVTFPSGSEPAGVFPAQPTPDFTNLGEDNDGPFHLRISLANKNTSISQHGFTGAIYEDIDHCVDGGVYAELVQNRGFQQGDLASWYTVGGSSIALSSNPPVLSAALPRYLQTSVSKAGMGFGNTGWWGFSVRNVPYRASFWARASSARPSKMNVALVSAANGAKWATSTVTITGTKWKRYETTITPGEQAPDNNNVFEITSADATKNTLSFQLISLFPPTTDSRRNGVRPDLVEHIQALKPGYCRFPGGNNLEGPSIAQRWIWNNTIGSLKNRPGRLGDWGYYNTDGMGLLEWLEFCEAQGATELILGLYAGFSLDGASVPRRALQPYIDTVLDEIEYIIGDESTPGGSLRAAHGHPAPFRLPYVEVGNEDAFSTTYGYRFPASDNEYAVYKAIKARYPDITVLATTALDIDFPPGVVWDQHFYGTPNQFQGLFSAYDNYPRNATPILWGEYAVNQYDNYSYPIYPFVEGTIAEAVFNIGLERNADIVLASFYAPYLSNIHYNTEHQVRLIAFDADPAQTVLSTSYHLIRLFSTHGNAPFDILPIATNRSVHPLYWSATSPAGARGPIYVKLANAGAAPQRVNLRCIDEECYFPASTARVVTGPRLASNTPENPDLVGIQSLDVSVEADGLPIKHLGKGVLRLNMPPWSAAVVTIPLE